MSASQRNTKVQSPAKSQHSHIQKGLFKVYLRLKPMIDTITGQLDVPNEFTNGSPRKSPSKSSTDNGGGQQHRRVTSVSPVRKPRNDSKDQFKPIVDPNSANAQKHKSLRTRTGSLNTIMAGASVQQLQGIRHCELGLELLKNLSHVGLTQGSTIKFPNVIQEDCDNLRVFQQIVEPMTLQVLEGGEGYTLLTYGISGSGKSHTVFGTVENPGMLLRAAQHLLASPRVEALGISMVEIYNEKVYDLLSPELKTLQVLETPHSESVVLPDLTLAIASKFAEFARLVVRAQDRRVVCPNMNNLSSSRSHVVIELFPRLRPNIMDDPQKVTPQAKLRFVDLAGSEKVVQITDCRESCLTRRRCSTKVQTSTKVCWR